MIAALGTASDADIAARYGISSATARRERIRRGIAAATPRNHDNRAITWTPEMVSLLGKVTDAEAGRRLGVGMTTVMRERLKRGIPPAMPQTSRDAAIREQHKQAQPIALPAHVRDKLLALEPAARARAVAAGQPIERIELWQIIEMAADALMRQIKP